MIFDTRLVGQTFADHIMVLLNIGKMDKQASQIEGRSEQITNYILHKLALNPSPNSANNEQFYGISAST